MKKKRSKIGVYNERKQGKRVTGTLAMVEKQQLIFMHKVHERRNPINWKKKTTERKVSATKNKDTANESRTNETEKRSIQRHQARFVSNPSHRRRPFQVFRLTRPDLKDKEYFPKHAFGVKTRGYRRTERKKRTQKINERKMQSSLLPALRNR